MHSLKYKILQGWDLEKGKTFFNIQPKSTELLNPINTLSVPYIKKTELVKGFVISLWNLHDFLETGWEL